MVFLYSNENECNMLKCWRISVDVYALKLAWIKEDIQDDRCNAIKLITNAQTSISSKSVFSRDSVRSIIKEAEVLLTHKNIYIQGSFQYSVANISVKMDQPVKRSQRIFLLEENGIWFK